MVAWVYILRKEENYRAQKIIGIEAVNLLIKKSSGLDMLSKLVLCDCRLVGFCC